MCTAPDHAGHRHSGISRRGFGTMALAGAGLALLPLRARASADIEALCITCIDYRFVTTDVKFFDSPPPDGLGLAHEYDLVALAGASLAAVSLSFPASIGALWDHIAIARSLHHIKRVVVLDHRDCGAYKEAFRTDYKGEEEYRQHQNVMRQMKTEFVWRKLNETLGLEFWLASLDAAPVPVPV
jgi:hypothetical protein